MDQKNRPQATDSAVSYLSLCPGHSRGKRYVCREDSADMEPIDIESVAAQLDGEAELFAEPLREGSMSVGVYRLAAGATDPQEPHAEDEAYYVLSGTAKIRIGETVHDLDPGDLVYVEREVDHEFFDIESELTTLVFFAPAYGSMESA